MNRHILAISGGGFSTENFPYIDEYLLKITSLPRPVNIAFIGTASHDAEGYIKKFYQAFKSEHASHITIDDMEKDSIQQILESLDIVYVGGGNTQHMLNIWHRTQFDKKLVQAYQNGLVLAGISAGAMCWMDSCFSENESGIYKEFKGIGILPGALCPHYNEEKRRSKFDSWVAQRNLTAIYTLEDHENLHFRNEVLVARISTVPQDTDD